MQDYEMSDCIENTKIKETYIAMMIDVASIDIQRQLEHARIGEPRQEVTELQYIPRAKME